jgi:four helix bundle protein
MTELEFKNRTKQVALPVIKLTNALPRTAAAVVIGKQILRSGTSIGANYRAACRAKSTADILHKLAIVEEEADETIYWLELLIDAEIIKMSKLSSLIAEINEILAMTVSSIKTIRGKRTTNPKSKIQNPKFTND